MTFNLFLNSERQLRNGWWILIFFLVLAGFLVPAMVAAQENNGEVSIGLQAVIVTLASLLCQFGRQKPLAELTGKFNTRWLRELFLGGLIGSALMLVPALFLGMFGWVRWHWNPEGISVLCRVYCSLPELHSQRNCSSGDLSFNACSPDWVNGQPNLSSLLIFC